MITLVVPCYGGGLNLERTIESCRGICNDVVIISTALFDEDNEHFKSVGRVVAAPWNFVFLHGYGELYNQATTISTNDWMLLLGTAETVAEQYRPIADCCRHAQANWVFKCNHVNDTHTWKRIWNRSGGPRWSGIIHEEIVNGEDGGVIFRMQDTDKTPRADAFQNEALRFIKTCSYNWLYLQLLRNPGRLGGANEGWLAFVNGAKESIEAFCDEHSDMISAAVDGDKRSFLKAVERRTDGAKGVNFNRTGTAMTK